MRQQGVLFTATSFGQRIAETPPACAPKVSTDGKAFSALMNRFISVGACIGGLLLIATAVYRHFQRPQAHRA